MPGKTFDLDHALPMQHMWQASELVVYRRSETAEGIVVTEHIREMVGLEENLESVLLIPLKSNERTLGICTVGEVRKWERSPFTKEKIKLAGSIADQAEGLIHRLQTYETSPSEGRITSKPGRKLHLYKIFQKFYNPLRMV